MKLSHIAINNFEKNEEEEEKEWNKYIDNAFRTHIVFQMKMERKRE